MKGLIYERSQQPLYLQVAVILRRNIESGLWPEESRIPSLDELTETLNVSRTTLRQAFGILESEGMIRRSRGSGPFVQARNEVKRLLLPTTWQETVALSQSLGTTTLRESTDDVTLPEHLKLRHTGDSSGRYQYWRRIHTDQDRPYCYTEVYLERNLYLRNPDKYRTSTVAPVLDELHRHELTCARQSLRIIEAGSDSASALQIPVSSPVAQLERYARIGDQIVYVARLEIPSHLVQMEHDLLGSPSHHE